MNKNLKYICITAVLLAIALIIGYLEQSLPAIIPYLPFVKIGFGNIVILFSLIAIGKKPAYVIATLKSILVPVFVGNLVMIAYSLPAAIISLTVTAMLVSLKKLSLPTISTISAIINIFIQICVAAIMTNSGLVFGYLGYLIAVSALSGFAIGTAVHFTIRKFPLSFIYNV